MLRKIIISLLFISANLCRASEEITGPILPQNITQMASEQTTSSILTPSTSSESRIGFRRSNSGRHFWIDGKPTDVYTFYYHRPCLPKIEMVATGERYLVDRKPAPLTEIEAIRIVRNMENALCDYTKNSWTKKFNKNCKIAQAALNKELGIPEAPAKCKCCIQ